MNQSFSKKFSLKRNLILPTLILFALFGFFFNQILPNKWFIKYSIDINVKLLATSQAIEMIFEELELKDADSPSLQFYLMEEVKNYDIRSRNAELQSLSKIHITNSPLELAFYTNDISNTEQEVKSIIDKLDNDLRPKIREWIDAYKTIAAHKLKIKKSSLIEKKGNELDFFDSETIAKGDLKKIYERYIDSTKQSDVSETEKSGNSEIDLFIAQKKKALDDIYSSTFRDFSKSIIKFEFEMLKKNKPENYEVFELLIMLESDLKEIKILNDGRLMTKFNKKPSIISSTISFLILGIFFIVLIFLLTSKSSKKLMTKMLTTLLNLK